MKRWIAWLPDVVEEFGQVKLFDSVDGKDCVIVSDYFDAENAYVLFDVKGNAYMSWYKPIEVKKEDGKAKRLWLWRGKLYVEVGENRDYLVDEERNYVVGIEGDGLAIVSESDVSVLGDDVLQLGLALPGSQIVELLSYNDWEGDRNVSP